MSANVTEPSRDLKSESGDTTYDKAKTYWNNVEPSVCGMLGGLPELGFIDIQASANFLKILFKFKPSPGKSRALDCGAGIGRVSKNLLMNEFTKVDLIEQDEKFCDKARETLDGSGRLGTVYNMGLQDFKDSGVKYDIAWSQWVLGHLTDDDLIAFLKELTKVLDKNGMIVVKENFTKDNTAILDDTDSSVTRPLSQFKKLVKQADLRIIKEARQTNFPKSIFPVYMLAMRPITK